MTEFTIHIESAEGLATEEGLSAMHDHLTADPSALGAAVGIDLPRGAYSATFQVDASGMATAAATATMAFSQALENAGHDAAAIGKLELVPETVTAAA